MEVQKNPIQPVQRLYVVGGF